MATALAAVRLPRPQPDGVDVAHGVRELGSSGVRVRTSAALGGCPPRGIGSESRGSMCSVPYFRTQSPRREALVSAMSEGEQDIVDMQETDKVSGEWWKNVLTAVHDWSSDKLLGLAELADGSLFFSFGGSDSARPAAEASAQSQPQTETKVNGSTHNSTRPPRQSSSFLKHSPIPASRKKTSVSEEAAAAVQPQAQEMKTNSSSKSARLQRPPSSFSKPSPIPKDRASKKTTHPPAAEAALKQAPSKQTPPKSTPARATSDSPFSPELKEILSHGKETSDHIVNSKTSSPAAAKKPSKSASQEPEAAQPSENGAMSEDLGSYRLPELRSLAKARGLKGYSKLKKGDLLELLASPES